ncbi:MAG: LysM peptidoglycan-binding domain-containing protein [Actinomycetaceae bacterium]|nr:LysM peptidoglycan-binding domain-containing protein [Actinomycetaceae bacterium]
MSALQIQPMLWETEAPRKSHLYVVPDVPGPSATYEGVRRPKSSAGSASMRSPKAGTAGLADTSFTKAGKALAFVSALTLLTAGGVALGTIFQPAVDVENTRIASVQAGDSLWSIAERLEIEDRSLEDVVTDIRVLNQLDSAVLTPGQILTVPTK